MPKMSFTTKLGMRKYNGLSSGKKWLNGKMSNVWTFDFNLLKPQFIDVNAVEEMSMDSDDEMI